MTAWSRPMLVIAAEEYAGSKPKHLLFKTKAVPPPWSDDLQHGVDAPLWDDELCKLPDDALIFVIESEPEPALLVQTIEHLRNCIDHRTAPSKEFRNGGVFWLRSSLQCLIGRSTGASTPPVQQLELFR
jgi:hypothetical protein